MPEKFDPEVLRQLCEVASKEMDSQRLLALVRKITELCESRDEPRFKALPVSRTRYQKSA